MKFPKLTKRPRPNLGALLLLAMSLDPCGVALAEDEAGIQLQFVSFPKSTDPQPVELRLSDGETLVVDLPSNNLSKSYRVKPMAVWALGKTSRKETGEMAFQTYGQAKSIGADNQLILVVRKGNRDSDGFDVIPLDNRVSGFGGGHFLIMNGSRVEISGNIGDEKFAIKPGGFEILSPEASATKENARKVAFVRISYLSDENIATPFFSSEWRFSEQARTLAFIYNDPLNQNLRLHVIRDMQ